MSNLSLNIQPRDNVLNGITLYEPIDTVILDKLINSTLLKATISNKLCKTFNTEKNMLIAYKALLTDNKIKVIYNRKDGLSFGRSNPYKALGLFTIRKEIRQTLCNNKFIDIDISNCHPNILYQILTANKISCPKLQAYINNRTHYLNLVQEAYKCNYETAKLLFIIFLYGGTFENWARDMINEGWILLENINDEYIDNGKLKILEEVKLFRDEIYSLMKIIVDNNPILLEEITADKLKRNKSLYNIKGSVCSYFLQEYEIRILEVVFKYCMEKEYIKADNAILCADGIMLEKKFFKPQILEELKTVINDEMGFDLTFTTKIMNLGYNETILNKSLLFDLYSVNFTSGLIADYFKIMYNDKFINVNDILYCFNGVYWEKGDAKNSSLHNFVDTTLYNDLNKYCINLHIENARQREIIALEPDNETKTDKLTKLDNKTKQINNFSSEILLRLRNIKQRIDIVKDIINKLTNNFIEFDNDPYLLAFTNKIYSLKDNKFIEPHYTQYIMTTTGWAWSNYYPKQRIEDLKNLIKTCFPNVKDGFEVMNQYLEILSTGLCGEMVEHFFIAKGHGGNGKSFINSLAMKALGHYAYKLPSSVITSDIKEGGNPQIALLHKKRLVIVQEPNSRSLVCSSTVKELTGDKTINSRMNYSNKCVISLSLTFICECNKLLHLDEVGDGMARRANIIPFDAKIVSKELYDTFEDKTGLIIANPEYKLDEYQHQNKQALIMILFEYWAKFQLNGYKLNKTPKRCLELVNDYLVVSDNIYMWFSNLFIKDNTKCETFTEEPKNYISIKHLYLKFQVSTVYETMSKADKRKYNLMKFTNDIIENMFLKPFYKDRDSIKIQNKTIKQPYLINWKLKGQDEEEDQTQAENQAQEHEQIEM